MAHNPDNAALIQVPMTDQYKAEIDKELAEINKNLFTKVLAGNLPKNLQEDLNSKVVLQTEGVLENSADNDATVDIVNYKVNDIAMDWYSSAEMEALAKNLKVGDKIEVTFSYKSMHVIGIKKRLEPAFKRDSSRQTNQKTH